MSQMLLYLKIEPYLAEWFSHENGGQTPIVLPRGSSESDILERFLVTRKDQKTIDEVSPAEANVVIAIPNYRDKPSAYYNYLPPRARKALERNIYVRFRVELWEELHTLENVDCPIGELIWSWMENHGITDDARNWEAIRQMYYRKRKAHKKKFEENGEN